VKKNMNIMSPPVNSSESQPLVTVFTPTFNRADKIHRAFESLMAQDCNHRLFEWVVIDDGSSDGTEAVIEAFRHVADFDIQYYFQKNSGKHVAHNRALSVARGELFLKCDSDDAFDGEAIGYFLSFWNRLNPADRIRYSGISVRCRSQHGNIVTPPMPREPIVSNNSEAVILYKKTGDGWGISRTDVLREFLFPEQHVGSHYPELIMWNRLGRKYKDIYTNKVLYTIFYDANNSITRNELAEDRGKWLDKALRESADYLNHDFHYVLRRPLFFVKRAVIYNQALLLRGSKALVDDQRLKGCGKWWCLLFKPLSFLAPSRFKVKAIK
jgi:glycosyltransferase involved in cell wall biosynthesis